MSNNELIRFENRGLPSAFADKFNANSADALITGGGGFPVLSFRGAKWRVKVSGEEHPLMNEHDEPVPSIEVVIVDVNPGVTKNYYAKKFAEGDDAAPDCSSHNGIVPDAGVPHPQCDSCAACPHNVWGSRITENGNKSKACSDSKVVAVTFADDMYNESIGGVMMLRVPPASLKDLSAFARGMKAKGFAPQQIVIRIGFDVNVSYPKLTFKAVRPLTNDEVAVIAELYDSEQVRGIIEGGDIIATSAPAKPAQRPAPQQKVVDTDFEEEAPAPSAKVAKLRVGKETAEEAEVTPVKKPAARTTRAAPKPEVAEDSPAPAAKGSAAESDIDDILADLDSL